MSKNTVSTIASHARFFRNMVGLSAILLTIFVFVLADRAQNENQFWQTDISTIERLSLQTKDHSGANLQQAQIFNAMGQQTSSTPKNELLAPCDLTYYVHAAEPGGWPGLLQLGVYGGEGFFTISASNPTSDCPHPNISVIEEDSDPNFIFTITGYQWKNPDHFQFKVFYKASVNLQGNGIPQLVRLDIRSSTNPNLGSFLNVHEDPGCAFKLETDNSNFVKEGGQQQLFLQSAPGCPAVTLATDVSWMRVNGTTLTVDPVISTDTGARSGTISIQGAGNVPVSLKIWQSFIAKQSVTSPKNKFYFRTKVGNNGVRG